MTPKEIGECIKKMKNTKNRVMFICPACGPCVEHKHKTSCQLIKAIKEQGK